MTPDRSRRLPRRLLTLVCLLACALSARVGSAQATHLVISQVYGGGGGSSTTTTYTFNTDYIEIYNPTSSAISLTGLSLQYGSSTGVFASAATNLKALSGTLQPGHYYLVTGSSGTAGGTLTVTADDTSTLSLSATGGKVALVNGTTSLGSSTACTASNVIDEVTYGTGSSCAEGTAAPAASNTTAVVRNSPSVDTNNNAADFSATTPNPHNSGSAANPVPPPVTAIAVLQGNRSTYTGTTVATTGVVTSVLYNGFFIQTPSSTPGSTGVAEGLDVYTGGTPTVSRGDNVTVTGKLQLYPAATASVTPALEITGPTITTNSTGNALPTAIALTTANLTPSGGLRQLTQYEGMRVSFASLTSISGTGGGSLDEVNEIYKSTGQFYAVITGTARPFREPGLDVRDSTAATAASTIPRFDDNPERILVDTYVGLNATPLDVSTGATFTNVTGVLDFTYSADAYFDPSRFIPDTATLTAGYTPGMTVQALALPKSGQATVAAFNVERFFNTTASDNINFYPVTGQTEASVAVNVTQAAYARRLTKVSLAIRHVLNNPDIVALEEVENGSVIADIAAQISADAVAAGETDPKYKAYGTDNVKFFTNDYGGISTGFLVKSTVDYISLDQFYNTTTFVPTGGKTTTTDDRPPFVLHAGIQRGTGVADYPITVIVNHMKALTDINTVSTQQKKELQAEELATLIQGYQAKGEHVLAVGDFNAFEFSDGYTDTLGTVTNRTIPANTVIQPGMAGLVTPSPTDLVLNLPATQRWSYVEDGNAQVLDHIVATADIAGSTTVAYGHLNADFPVDAYNDATTPARTSDHDPALAYLTVPAPVLNATFTGTGTFTTTVVGATSSGQVFTLTNTGEGPATISSIVTTGDFAQSNNCGTSLARAATCAINVVFRPTAGGARTGSLTVNSTVSISAAALTGTALVPDFTLSSAISGSGTTSLTAFAGAPAGFTLNLTSVNTFAGTVSFACTATGTGPTGVTCTVPSATLASGGTATTNVLFTTTSRTTSSGFGSLPGSGRAPFLFLLATVCAAAAMLSRRGRAVRVGGLLVLMLALAAGITGCGSGSHSNAGGTPAGTYSYTVTATGGGMTHTQAVSLTVQ